MTRIFVDTECGTVSDHFDFNAVPHAGDIVFVLNENEEIKLRVNLVEHYVIGKGDLSEPVSSVTLQCERLNH
jgi:hypothetical protein